MSKDNFRIGVGTRNSSSRNSATIWQQYFHKLFNPEKPLGLHIRI